MTKRTAKKRPKTLVYGMGEHALVFIPRARAVELAAVWRAIMTASTWGELHILMPKGRYRDVLARHVANGGDRPVKDEAFAPEDIPGFADGDYPGWPAQEMLQWVPRRIVSQPFSRVADSMINGTFLMLDPSREQEIVAAFSSAGFRCIKDQALVSAAEGMSSSASE